jgi:hypothetical protein
MVQTVVGGAGIEIAIASEAKQSIKHQESLDCFASLAMTGRDALPHPRDVLTPE